MTEPHQMTVRLPQALYERLRQDAFDRRKPMSEIIEEALEAHLAQKATWPQPAVPPPSPVRRPDQDLCYRPPR